MANFAKLGVGNIVEQVIVVSNDIATTEQAGIDFINNLYNTRDVWKQTSYNTHGGQYYNSDLTLAEDQTKAFRKNFACPGGRYDDVLDAFIPPKPFNSWIFNEIKCNWKAPIDCPTDGSYYWSERTLSWVLMPSY